LVVDFEGSEDRKDFHIKAPVGVIERFSRGSTAIPGGTGLGLALVRESAIALGGEARASRAAAGGLEVRVSLPRE